MTHHRDLLIHMFNLQQFVDPQLIQDLDRLEQLDRLMHWYEGLNPFPSLIELAEHQLKQRVEATALAQFTDSEFEAFRFQWQQLTKDQQRSFLCDLAGLPDHQRDRDLVQ
jgi:hypothetical protein